MADEPKAARANVSVAVKPPSKALPPVPPERPGSPPPRSSGSGVMRSSTSGVFAAPANSLAGMTLPPISAPHRPGYSSAATPPPLPPPRLASKPKPREEIVEVLSDDVMPVEDDALDEAASSDEVMEADGLGVDPTSDEVSLPPSALDPWFAQLVHGYCPPEAQLFARHVPPTTMPGRD